MGGVDIEGGIAASGLSNGSAEDCGDIDMEVSSDRLALSCEAGADAGGVSCREPTSEPVLELVLSCISNSCVFSLSCSFLHSARSISSSSRSASSFIF